MGSFSRALGVVRFVGFVRARPGGPTVHSCAPRESLGLFGFVGFIRARPRVRSFHSVAPRGSLGSFLRVLADAGFIRTLPGVHLVSLSTFESALEGRCVHSGMPCVSLGSFRFVGVIGARVLSSRVHSCSLGSFR